DTLAEELLNVCRVLGVIPWTLAEFTPLLGRAREGFSVGSGHDDTVKIGGVLVQWVINTEHTVPHGGPEEVGTKTKQELKDGLVEARVEELAIILLEIPVGESGLLIVEEDTTVLNRGR